MIQFLMLLLTAFQVTHATDVGTFSKALWFLHAHGNGECSLAKNDLRLKGILTKSLADDHQLSFEELKELVSPDVFLGFAGSDGQLSEAELTRVFDLSIPRSRKMLEPDLCRHADLLVTSFDMIAPEHFDGVDQLSEWIFRNWQPDKTLHILTTCTGNSRRSILGAAMGNLAAAYYGLDNIRFESGGITPTAFNKRTIATLKEIGFQVEPTGKESQRGDPKVSNPIYRIVWGRGLEKDEFSKSYKHDSNPQDGFAAIMVCNEADTVCPVVAGAAIRISMNFLDPKSYDDSVFETKKYAERRDDMGRCMLAVMVNARRRIMEKNSRK